LIKKLISPTTGQKRKLTVLGDYGVPTPLHLHFEFRAQNRRVRPPTQISNRRRIGGEKNKVSEKRGKIRCVGNVPKPEKMGKEGDYPEVALEVIWGPYTKNKQNGKKREKA